MGSIVMPLSTTIATRLSLIARAAGSSAPGRASPLHRTWVGGALGVIRRDALGRGYRRPWEARRIGTGVQEGVGDESHRRRLVGDQGHDNRALGPAGAYYGGALRGRLASLRGAVARHRPCGDGGSRP